MENNNNTIDLINKVSIDYNKYLNCTEEVIKELLEQNKTQILKKVINIDNNEFIYIYNKKNYDYDNEDLISMFRSVLYVKEDNLYKIINYTYNNVVYNTNVIYSQDIYESYEGTNITVFNYKNKWYYTTTKCIDNLDLTNNISYGIMLLETLNNNKDNLKKLEEIMNKDYNYNFIIVNHNNKYINDYTDQFGLNYSKLIFTDCKNQNNQLPLEDEYFNKQIIENNIFKNILRPVKVDYKKVNLDNREYIIKKYDGFILRITKLVSSSYLFKKDLKGNFNNKLEVYINNFKKNKIDDLLIHFKSYNICISNLNMKQIMCLLFTSLSDLIYILYKYKYENNSCEEEILKKYIKTFEFIDNIKKISLQNNKNSTNNKFIYNHLKNYTYTNLIYILINELYKDINNLSLLNNDLMKFKINNVLIINVINKLL